MNHDNHLKAADVAAHVDVTVESIPNFDMLSARRKQRMRVMLASAAAVVAVPLAAIAGISQFTGGSDLVIRGATTGAATATGQSASMAGGNLALGNAVTETVVIDQQFRSMRDGFGFANYSGAPKNDIVDASVMAALFTKEAVCVDPTAGTCVMLPAAQKIADQMNTAIAVGRCEGMAVLSQRYFDKLDVRVKNASDTVSLTQPDVAKQLSYWWATQIAPPVTKESKRFRAMTPSQIVAELETGLKAKKGYTMGIYSSLGGHSVTPIAVTNDGAKKIVYIYDNNYPREVRKLVIDPAAQTWTYAGAATSSGAKASDWTGKGAGTLDLTPMAARKGPFEVSFGATRGLKGTSFAVIVTQNAGTEVGTPDVGVRIRGKLNGKQIDVSSVNVQDVLNAPFEIRNLVGGITGRGAIAYVPIDLANFAEGGLELQVIGDESAGPIQLSVLRTGSATVSVESASDFTVNVTTRGFGTTADVILPNGSDSAQVLVSNGPRAAELNLVNGQSVEVTTTFNDDDAMATRARRIEDTSVAFSIRSAAEKDSAVVLADGVKGAVQSGTAIVQRYDFDAAKGSFAMTEVPVQAQSLDTTFVKDMQNSAMPTDQTLVAEEECDPEDLFGPCFGGFRAAALPDSDDDSLDLSTFRGAAPAPTTTAPSTTTTTVPAPTTTVPAPTTTVPETTTTTTTVAPPPPPPGSPTPQPLLSMTLTATGTREYGHNNTATKWNVACTGDCSWWNSNTSSMSMNYGTIDSTTSVGSYNTVTMVMNSGYSLPSNLTMTSTTSLSITKAENTISFTVSSPVTYGVGSVTVNPTATSGDPVELTSGTEGVCEVTKAATGYSVLIKKIGNCELLAKENGNDNYFPATDVPRTIVVDPAPITVQVNAPPRVLLTSGSQTSPVSVTISPSSGGATTWSVTGQCTFTGSGTSITVTFTDRGDCGITATVAANGDFTEGQGFARVTIHVDENNGHGNGDQNAPGNSDAPNNAENSDNSGNGNSGGGASGGNSGGGDSGGGKDKDKSKPADDEPSIQADATSDASKDGEPEGDEATED